MCNPNLQLLETGGAEDYFREQNQSLLLLGSSGKWRRCSSVLLLLLLRVTTKTRACGPPVLLQHQLLRWVTLDISARAPRTLPHLTIV